MNPYMMAGGAALKGIPTWLKIVLFVVLGGFILYFISILFKPFFTLFKGISTGFDNAFEGLGITESKQEKAIEQNYEQSIQDQIEQARSTENSTKSRAEWAVIAEQIHRDLGYSGNDNEDDAGYQICRVKNNVDFWELYNAFGIRKNYTLGVPTGEYNLAAFVRSELDTEKINQVNLNYRSKGIKFQY